MEYTRLGETGVQVSRICLGCMSYGTPEWRPWVHDADASAPFFKRAIEAGINFFDTADMYSLGVSEEVTGRWLREYGVLDEIVIGTKVFFPMGPGADDRGLSRGAILKQAEASLRRLDTDVIDLYQIHRHDPSVPWDETLSALTDLVSQGKVRHIGCSTNHWDVGDQPRLTAWQIVETLWISERSGSERFVSLQPPYSILRRTMELEHFPMSLDHSIGNLVWSPLEGGWLANRYRYCGSVSEMTPRFERWMKSLDNPKFERRSAAVDLLAEYLESRRTPTRTRGASCSGDRVARGV